MPKIRRLDWSYKFPIQRGNGRHGYGMSYMYTQQMLKRSKYIVRALKEDNPPKTREIHGISLPPCSQATLEYYQGCVETGDARVSMPLVTVSVTRTGEEEDFEDPYAEEDEEQSYEESRKKGDTNMEEGQDGVPDEGEVRRDEDDDTVNENIDLHCNGYFFAVALEDCQTANLIIDALIAYTIEAGTLLNASHVQHIRARRAEGRKLYDFALDLWAPYASASCAAEVREAEPKFWADVEARRAQVEGENPGMSVEEVLGGVCIAEERGRYHCFDELYPPPEQSDGEE